MFFLEDQIGAFDPPSVTHPEFYYGFVCAAFAWQIVYLMMSRDPLRFRPMLLPAIAEKAGFGISVLVLFTLERLPAARVVLPSVDLLLAAFFVWGVCGIGTSGVLTCRLTRSSQFGNKLATTMPVRPQRDCNATRRGIAANGFGLLVFQRQPSVIAL